MIGPVVPYGPCSFDNLTTNAPAEFGQATTKYLVTNAPDDQLQDFDGWQVVRPYPARRSPSGGRQTSRANCPRCVGFTARDQSE